jgi:hypothetical protein
MRDIEVFPDPDSTCIRVIPAHNRIQIRAVSLIAGVLLSGPLRGKGSNRPQWIDI